MKYSREQDILNRLQINGRMELSEAMGLFDISESTARRLFSRMEQAGTVIRTHGGISLIRRPMEYSFERLSKAHMAEKTAIASKACGLLKDGDIIFCDSGTTVLCFCIELAHRISQNELNITVFTNSLANLEVLTGCAKIALLGGNYREYRKDFYGYLVDSMLKKLFFDKCFLGADGYNMHGYFTTTDADTAGMDETVIRNSQKTIILCDSSKFSTCTQIGYASFDDVSTVVTDKNINSTARKRLENSGIAVCCADES